VGEYVRIRGEVFQIMGVQHDVRFHEVHVRVCPRETFIHRHLRLDPREIVEASP
jgi:hypothetical protein